MRVYLRFVLRGRETPAVVEGPGSVLGVTEGLVQQLQTVVDIEGGRAPLEGVGASW